MVNKYVLLLLVGLAVILHVPTTDAYGLCSCFCCDGDSCDPIPEGTAYASSCAEPNCLIACKEQYPDACNSSTTGTVNATCQEVSTTSVSTPLSPTTTNVTVPTSPTSSPESTTTITSTPTLSPATTSTETAPIPTTYSGASVARESPSFIALLATCILTITKIML